MPIYHHKKILNYDPQFLFDLVGDIESYPDFIPWITSLKATTPHMESDGSSRLEAKVRVGFAILSEVFVTLIVRNPNDLTIKISHISGPFRKLDSLWKFQACEEGTEVSFQIDFEFRSRILGALFAAHFDKAVIKIMALFEARAKTLSGA